MPFHGKTLDERQLVWRVSEVAAEVCRDVGIDLRRPWTNPESLPKKTAQELYLHDRRTLTNADCLIAFWWNSAGTAQQLELAANRLMPVVFLVPNGMSLSRCTQGSLVNILGIVSFTAPEDIRTELGRILKEAEPNLLVRRHVRPRKPFGAKIAKRVVQHREALGMSRQALAARSGIPLSLLEGLEREDDAVTNLSVTLFYALAEALDVPVSWLLEPNSEATLRALEEQEIAELCLEADNMKFSEVLEFQAAMRPSYADPNGKRPSREELRTLVRIFLEISRS